jgi:hypothetical protein
MDEFDQIMQMDIPDLEKMAKAYDHVTRMYLEHSQKELEVLKALNDRESLVKEQIKLETVKFCRGIFDDCYQRITRKAAFDE